MDQEDKNVTDFIDIEDYSGNFNEMKIVQVVIGSMGIITNIIVVIGIPEGQKNEKENTKYLYYKPGLYILTSYKRKVMRF